MVSPPEYGTGEPSLWSLGSCAQVFGQRVGHAGCDAPEHGVGSGVEGDLIFLGAPVVVLAAWNRREGKIIREALLQADRVNVGIPLQDPVQGQGKDLVDLCLRPGVLIVLQSAYKGVERDAAGRPRSPSGRA